MEELLSSMVFHYSIATTPMILLTDRQAESVCGGGLIHAGRCGLPSLGACAGELGSVLPQVAALIKSDSAKLIHLFSALGGCAGAA
jgi:hypothetical protein